MGPLLTLIGLLLCSFPKKIVASQWQHWGSAHASGFCRNPNLVSIAGSAESRMAPEGGRIVVVCCLPGNTTGHDHEQLTWTDPLGKPIMNYFVNSAQAALNRKYAVPDFSETQHIISRLVVRDFEESDKGAYTCSQRRAEGSGGVIGGGDHRATPAKVYLVMRPRLLADYTALLPPSRENGLDGEDGDGSNRPTAASTSSSSSSVFGASTSAVAGHRVSFPLEEGQEGRLVCRTNPNFHGPIRVTWFYHGRQLIGPAAAMLEQGGGGDAGTPRGDTRGRHGNRKPWNAKQITDRVAAKVFIDAIFRPVVVDPTELGVTLENNSHVLRFARLSARHAGMYMCKAEAHNPLYVRPTALDEITQSLFAQPVGLPITTSKPIDPTSGSDGTINTEFLVQIQPIRLIVFSRPRMLPGNPRLTPTRTVTPPSPPQPPPIPPPLWHQYPTGRQRRRVLRSVDGQVDRSGIPSWAYAQRPVAREAEKMILECAARGNPPPTLIWFKGGGGTSLPQPNSLNGGGRDEVNFDVAIREAFNYLPIDEAKRYLGTLVAEDSQIFPAILESSGKGVGESAASSKKVSDFDATLGPKEVDFAGTRLDRFSVVAGLRKDDTGKPVIAVSRLIVDNLRVTDATRYTCLAQLNMEPLGGHGNWTDVGSLLPAIVLYPQFVAAGTKLYATGYPGENATMTCEALGGLSIPGGLQLSLLRGAGLKDLAQPGANGQAQPGAPSGHPTESPPSATSATSATSAVVASVAFRGTTDIANNNNGIGGGAADQIEVIRPGVDPRYHLTAGPDPKNPYAAMIRLTITNLRPEDNNYYACKAQSGELNGGLAVAVNAPSTTGGGGLGGVGVGGGGGGGSWVAYAPSPEEALGRLSVWFAPPSAGPVGAGVDTDKTAGAVMYGLAHKPSRLECRALGQPPPQWSWTGPAIRKVIEPTFAGQTVEPEGYIVRVHQEGEESVSELTLPAAYWSFGVFGSYSCTATNRLGNATGYVRLKLATHPHRPKVTACTVEATLVELCVIPPTETGGLPLTHYELRIQPSLNERFHGPFAYLPGRRVVRLPDLTPNHFYKFALSAVTSAGRGPNTYIEITTRQIGVPKLRLIATNSDVTSSDYLVRWILETDGGSPVVMYKIQIRPTGSYWTPPVARPSSVPGTWTVFDVLSSDADRPTRHGVEGMYRIKSLQPGTAYEVNLVGQNAVGQSDPYIVVFRTSELTGTSGRLLHEPVSQHLHGNDGKRSKSFNIFTSLVILFPLHLLYV